MSRALLYAMHAAVAGGITAAACGGSSSSGGGAPFACGSATCNGNQYCQQNCERGGNPPPTCVDQPTCGATAPSSSERLISCPCPPYGCVFPDACGAAFV
ncbi:MAG TPA: hypothetical protein VIF62_00100 [Labilithrix sp.]